MNLGIKHWIPFYPDIRINFITLRYPVMIIPCRDNFNWGINHWSSNLKVLTLDIKIKRLNKTISIHSSYDLWIFSDKGQRIKGQLIKGQLIKGQRIKGQLIKGQRIKGQLIKGQLIKGKRIIGQRIKGQRIKGQLIKGQLITGQRIKGQLAKWQRNKRQRTRE